MRTENSTAWNTLQHTGEMYKDCEIQEDSCPLETEDRRLVWIQLSVLYTYMSLDFFCVQWHTKENQRTF